MSTKKHLASLETDLAALAQQLPSQNVPAANQGGHKRHPAAEVKETPESMPEEEPVIQFSLSLRESLRKQLAQLALESDCTMRAFVLNALKDKGLNVTGADLIDRRKR
jgi:hypothetical protein